MTWLSGRSGSLVLGGLLVVTAGWSGRLGSRLTGADGGQADPNVDSAGGEVRKTQLRRNVALSTIRVRLHEPRPEPGAFGTSHWYDTPILVAFLESFEE